jgi:hypothetical protein
MNTVSSTTAARRNEILNIIDRLGFIPSLETMSALLTAHTPYHASVSLVHMDYVAMGLNKGRRLERWAKRFNIEFTTRRTTQPLDTAQHASPCMAVA